MGKRPDQPNVPRQFRFQTQLPESERAQHPSRTSAPGSSRESPPANQGKLFVGPRLGKLLFRILSLGPNLASHTLGGCGMARGISVDQKQIVLRPQFVYIRGFCHGNCQILSFLNGHPGVDKLIKGLRNRYNFPPLPSDQNPRELATRVKRGCAVCQACEHPNWATKCR